MVTNDLFGAYDAIHGSIDISDVVDARLQATIARLLRLRPLERLRSIKQLGFVSRGYPAADHSRFGHAVGTLQMMRKLIHRIRATRGLPPELLHALEKRHHLVGDPWQHVAHHLMLAALLQDIGELPYHQATKEFFFPSQGLKNSIRNNLGDYAVHNWKTKDVFTVGCLNWLRQHDSTLFEGISLPLLIYLITEQSRKGEDETPFLPLRHMLDGAVDADRLDYVYRDGHHTIGYFGTPQSVIDSLLRYEDEGPVFCEPAPVSNLLLMRAHLYITVYLSPVDRFQTQLLKEILGDVAKIESQQQPQVFRELLDGVEVDEFLRLEDSFLISKVEQVDKYYRGLSGKARKALDILLKHQGNYESIWLLPPPPGSVESSDILEPDDLFFDTFFGKDPRIYKPRSIRIECGRFSDEPIFLEQTSAIFEGIAANEWSPLPKPGSILLFKPKAIPRDSPWEQIEIARKDGSLYLQLSAPKDLKRDTRNGQNFLPPDLFISYAFTDRAMVLKVAKMLEARKQKYFLLDDSGPNRPAVLNSQDAVARAEAFLVVLSSDYLNRFQTAQNGPLAAELFDIFSRVSQNVEPRIPLVFLNLNADRELIENRLPWRKYLGWSAGPVIEQLDPHDKTALEREVDRILNEIRSSKSQ